MSPLLLLLFVALATYLALRWLDDSSAQIVVLPVAIAGVVLSPEPYRLMAGLGVLLGVIGFLAVFFYERGRSVPMPNYDRPDGSSQLDQPGVVVAESNRSRTGTAPMPDGPYYLSQTPETTELARPGTPGSPMTFEGHIVQKNGEPASGAAIEIWHANGEGDYDLAGYNCRGHQFADEKGAFRFQTVRPFGYGKASISMIGIIDFRAAHFHVKIKTDEGHFTTSLFFPDDERCQKDVGYRMVGWKNVVEIEAGDKAETARFDFVI